MKTLVGAWLGDEPDKNEEEIANLIDLAKKGYVDIAAVGNEILYRKDLTEEELLAHMHHVDGDAPLDSGNLPLERGAGAKGDDGDTVRRTNLDDLSYFFGGANKNYPIGVAIRMVGFIFTVMRPDGS